MKINIHSTFIMIEKFLFIVAELLNYKEKQRGCPLLDVNNIYVAVKTRFLVRTRSY